MLLTVIFDGLIDGLHHCVSRYRFCHELWPKFGSFGTDPTSSAFSHACNEGPSAFWSLLLIADLASGAPRWLNKWFVPDLSLRLRPDRRVWSHFDCSGGCG
ncbi:unnamed protein product [Calypogeia fissa]